MLQTAKTSAKTSLTIAVRLLNRRRWSHQPNQIPLLQILHLKSRNQSVTGLVLGGPSRDNHMPLKSLENIIEATFIIVLAAINVVGCVRSGKGLTFTQKWGLLLVVLVVAHAVGRCFWP